MPSHSWTRRSYVADVLVVPLDPAAHKDLAVRRDSLAGVGIADVARLDGDTLDDGLREAVERADAITLITSDLSLVDHGAVAALGEAARTTGTLLGAVVAPGLSWSSAEEHASAAVLREHVDTLVVLRDLPPALHFLRVLRGGTRDSDPFEEGS